MNLVSLYQTVYQILNQTTPLRFDCGKLCRRACCQNLPADIEAGEDFGMYLFPGEEVMLRQAAFLKIIPVHFDFNLDFQILLATCNGECDRNLRPLACRIFPLTPYLTLKDILTARIDPRAIPVCPLTDLTKLQYNFLQNVRKACRLLISEPRIKSFIAALSRMFDEYYPFISNINNKKSPKTKQIASCTPK